MNSAGSSTEDHLVTDFLTGYLLRLCPIDRCFSTEPMIEENHSVEDNHKRKCNFAIVIKYMSKGTKIFGHGKALA